MRERFNQTIQPRTDTPSSLRGVGRRRSGACSGPRTGKSRAFSLIEILVVLVILVIGIFAITRLFPQGFAALNQSASITAAESLSRYQEDTMRKNQESLPDAVVAVDWNPARVDANGVSLLREYLNPENLHETQPYIDNAVTGPGNQPIPDLRHSDVNAARRVLGEQFKVPPPTPIQFDQTTQSASLYRVLFAPIYSIAPHRGSSRGVAVYSGTPVTRVPFKNQSPLDEQDLQRLAQVRDYGYGVDYDRSLLYFFAVPYDRRFRLQYSFRAANGSVVSTVPESCIFIPADSSGTPNPDPNNNNTIRVTVFDLKTVVAQPPGCQYTATGGASLMEGSDFLYRQFDQLQPGDAWNAPHPFIYKIYDTVSGLIGLHPQLATLTLPTQEGRGITVKVDYDVDDWHILRQDVVVPAQAVDTDPGSPPFYAIKLLSGGIKRVQDEEDVVSFVQASGVQPTNTYQGLVRYYPPFGNVPARPGTPGVDVVLVDMETGLGVNSSSLNDINNFNGEIKYQAGVIHLRDVVEFQWPPASATPAFVQQLPVAGRRLRVFYRNNNDSGVAMFKPYSNYVAQSNLSQLQGGQYFPDYGFGYILFPNIDAGRTVAVDYTWTRVLDPNTTPPTVEVRREVGELHEVRRPESPPVEGPSASNWWIRLAHAETDPGKGGQDRNADPDVQPGSVRIEGIRGASFHTRVVWRDAENIRYRDRTTILTRSHSR